MTSVVIGNSVTSIGSGAFYGCSGLTSVVIGHGVTSIRGSAFYDCTDLTSVYYKGAASDWSEISIGPANAALTGATIYYYSETEPALNAEGSAYDGNFWRYDEQGAVVVWIYTEG